MLFDQGIEIPEALQTGSLNVELMPDRTRFNVRVKATDVAAFKKSSGLNLPGKIGQTRKSGEQLICKLGPDEWVVSDDPKQENKLVSMLDKMSAKFVMSATDISHRNVSFILKGEKAVDTVNVGCPLDLSLDAYPIGKATRTVFENAPIQLYRAGENELHVECWRSFAPYLCDFFNRIVTT